MAILEIDSLEVRYRAAGAEARAVDGVSLALEANECLGLIGESGCGKSTIAKAVMGILPRSARVAGGSIRFQGRELLGLPEEQLRRLRGKEIAMIPQAAMNGFDPVYTVEQQMVETIAAHVRMPREQMRARIEEQSLRVGLPLARLAGYPHQFSGGMRQRAMIALALLLDPKVIVADEPTTGLDVLVQDQILRSITANSIRAGKAMLLITHDLGVVAENCDRIAVMYAGRVVEEGDRNLFTAAMHPYTLGLCNAAFPDPRGHGRTFVSIAGDPPSLSAREPGCRFRARCPFATARCVQEPPLVRVAPKQAVACHHLERAEEIRDRARDPATWQSAATGS